MVVCGARGGGKSNTRPMNIHNNRYAEAKRREEEGPKPASGAQIDMARFLEAATVEQEERPPKAVCGDRLLRAVDEVVAARSGVT